MIISVAPVVLNRPENGLIPKWLNSINSDVDACLWYFFTTSLLLSSFAYMHIEQSGCLTSTFSKVFVQSNLPWFIVFSILLLLLNKVKVIYKKNMQSYYDTIVLIQGLNKLSVEYTITKIIDSCSPTLNLWYDVSCVCRRKRSSRWRKATPWKTKQQSRRFRTEPDGRTRTHDCSTASPPVLAFLFGL